MQSLRTNVIFGRPTATVGAGYTSVAPDAENLEVLIHMSATSAKASLLLALLSLQEEDRATAFSTAKTASDEVLDIVLAEAAVASPFGQRLMTHVLTSNTETLNLTAGEMLVYAASLAPVIEGFSLEAPHEADAMYDVRSASRIPMLLMRSGAIAADTSFLERVTIARGALIRSNTIAGLVHEDLPNRVDEFKWLGSRYRDITTIARELIERRSCDPMLITDLLRKGSAASLRDGIL